MNKDNLTIREVPFKQIREQIQDSRLEIYGVSSFYKEPETSEMVEETLLPYAYNDISGARETRTRTNKKDPFLKLGEDNQYPFFLLDLFTKSPTHKKAYKASCNLSYGDGLVGVNNDGANFLKWLKSKGATPSYIKNHIKYLTAFGGSYSGLHFIKQVTNEGSTKYILDELKVYPYQKMRVGKREEEGENIGESIFNWFHPQYDKLRGFDRRYLRGIPIFSSIEEVQTSPKFMVKNDRKSPYLKENPPSNQNKYSYLIGDTSLHSDFYPQATYETDALFYAVYLEAALAAFDSAGLRNGLMAGYIVTVPLADTSRRDPDKYKVEKEKVKTLVEDKLQGAENNQRIVVVFQDPSDTTGGVQISAIPHTNTSQMHTMMDQRKRQNILSAWGIPDSRLIGLPVAGPTGFSNQSEVLKTSEEVWYNLSISEIVSPLHDFINGPLKEIYMYEENLLESDAEVFLKRKVIFNHLPSDIILLSDFTRNERRKRFGLEALNEDSQKILEDEKIEQEKIQNNPTTLQTISTASDNKYSKAYREVMQELEELKFKMEALEEDIKDSTEDN